MYLAEPTEYRDVGGRLVTSYSAGTESTRVELLSRESMGSIGWRFRQSRLTLLWFQSGISEMHLKVDGKIVDSSISMMSNLALIPSFTNIEGDFKVEKHCSYAAIFLDPKWVRQRIDYDFDEPLLAFGHQHIHRSLLELCGEVQREDSLYELFVEGWSLQTLALLSRMITIPTTMNRPIGGLAESKFIRVCKYIIEDLSQPFTIDDLSRVAGVSARHFSRAFQARSGQTPFRYIMGLRIEQAKRMLATTERSVTDVAMECGFSHAQHFANSFRVATGITPSAYRKSFLL
ncbi:AraC family transcriptional regulator [Paraburkholderia ferrariae]|uniref:AraC family transcriptional regulator n=1 Tax=Paraburkholderia ferrariae TaxID=386056 RepID=A0ABU9RZY7_9BURK